MIGLMACACMARSEEAQCNKCSGMMSRKEHLTSSREMLAGWRLVEESTCSGIFELVTTCMA